MVLKPRINQAIRAAELRVIGPEGENLGVQPLEEAWRLAREAGLDLIEISPNAKPPVARIMDFGKYQYQLDKEARKSKKKAREVEIKGLRARLGTSMHDLVLKAKKAEEFLKEGHRVQVQLTLRGREKYIDKKFIDERIAKILDTITVPFKVGDAPKKGPRGILITIEPDHGKNKQVSPQESTGDKNGKDSQASTQSKPLQRKEAPSETTQSQKVEGV